MDNYRIVRSCYSPPFFDGINYAARNKKLEIFLDDHDESFAFNNAKGLTPKENLALIVKQFKRILKDKGKKNKRSGNILSISRDSKFRSQGNKS